MCQQFWDTRSEAVPWIWPNTASTPCSSGGDRCGRWQRPPGGPSPGYSATWPSTERAVKRPWSCASAGPRCRPTSPRPCSRTRSRAELQAQIDRFVHIYNEERPHTARGCPPMQAWRDLDKATVEVDGQPLLAHTKVRHDRIDSTGCFTLRCRSGFHLFSVGRRAQRQAGSDLGGRPRRPGLRRRRDDPPHRARSLGQLPRQVADYPVRVHVSQKIRDITEWGVHETP
jgi:hypothetical protein